MSSLCRSILLLYFRPKCYASLPIIFRPVNIGEFTGELVIQPESTNALRVKLIGSGV